MKTPRRLLFLALILLALGLGSNNWTVGSRLSAGGKPIVANDPHLDARMLPGPWYPSGLFTPQFRAVGANIPGLPGIVVGRTDYAAFGLTNAYGDTQDLYVETVDPKDPGKYIEGDKSLPFQIVEETLVIKDKNAPQGNRTEKVRIRFTRRGPVISGVLSALKTDKVMTLRYAPFESMDPCVGLHLFLTAKSVEEATAAIEHLNIICLNVVSGDRDGNIGWRVTGKLPIRAKGDGTVPFVVTDSEDNWSGFIPFDKMPHSLNPQRAGHLQPQHNPQGLSLLLFFSSLALLSLRKAHADYRHPREEIRRRSLAVPERHGESHGQADFPSDG
jgi:penicillin G amidase